MLILFRMIPLAALQGRLCFMSHTYLMLLLCSSAAKQLFPIEASQQRGHLIYGG